MNYMSNVKGVMFVHMNTRSIYRRLDEIRLFYHEFDFICCSETWLDDRYTDPMIHIDNMNIYRLDRPRLRRDQYRFNNGGGVLIYVNNKWVSYCTVFAPGTLSTVDIEIITLKVDKPNFKTFFVSTVYKPPKGDSTKCMNSISEIIALNPTCEFWILGDFNVDYLKRNVCSTKKVLNIVRRNGLDQLIKSVTRPAIGKGTCIDWILTNSEFVSLSFVSNHLISDHYPVICVRKKSRELKENVPKYVRLFNRLDFKILADLLSSLDWTQFDESNDVDLKWLFVKSSVSEILKVMCPLKKIYVRKTQPPWFGNKLYKLICERERLSRIFRNTGDVDVLRKFKIARNVVTQAIRDARSSYISTLLHVNKNNPRKFWRIISDFQNKKVGAVYDGEFVDPETDVTVPLDNLSIFLNDYFATIGSKLNTLGGTVLDDLDGIYEEMEGESFSFPEVDRFDILFLAKDIDIHKSSCIPDMRTDV